MKDVFLLVVFSERTHLRMALEMQYTGFQRGYEIGFPHFTVPASTSPSQAFDLFGQLENVGQLFLNLT